VDVSIIGRNTKGVTLINISKGEKLVSVEKIAETEDDGEELPNEGDTEVSTEEVE
jgi:DNA gyrase subunit A